MVALASSVQKATPFSSTRTHVRWIKYQIYLSKGPHLVLPCSQSLCIQLFGLLQHLLQRFHYSPHSLTDFCKTSASRLSLIFYTPTSLLNQNARKDTSPRLRGYLGRCSDRHLHCWVFISDLCRSGVSILPTVPCYQTLTRLQCSRCLHGHNSGSGQLLLIH